MNIGGGFMKEIISKPSKGFYARADQVEAVIPKKNKKGEYDIIIRFKSGWSLSVIYGKFSDEVATSLARALAQEIWGEAVSDKAKLIDCDALLAEVFSKAPSENQQKE